MSVLRQVRRDGEDVDLRGQVLGPVVDEDGGAAAHGKMRREIAAVGVTSLLREVTADKVIHPELSGPVPGVVAAARAPQEDPAAAGEVLQDLACPGRSDVPVSESTRHPSTSKTQQPAPDGATPPVRRSWLREVPGIIGILYSR